MSVAENLNTIKKNMAGYPARLIAVTKTHPVETLREAYEAGARIFGENKVQEMVDKWKQLPEDIQWHMIGHLQTNKVKPIAPFVSLIHSVDSFKLLLEINKQAGKAKRVIDCLLQIHIATEETKFGFSFQEAEAALHSEALNGLQNVRIVGLMGMASNTEDNIQVRMEFRGLKQFFDRMKATVPQTDRCQLQELSMGMSGDYEAALQEGSTLIRVGSAIFGAREYAE
ncbi:YggS family pyridoxal phosphate-dependent enzyme [Siphonobacter sp. SORGH_AS_0500]|uniref:YggS family pyridoxal phosphate-dependent enzyme n=1 Tax=Siphonobacter sp. SORGH_AS_0500 TaxID=1864824 RepID=UPI000CCA1CF2|nr:YggS family pyridoxal phosphate-dependent enzyme [Siphonobacter sp. SORGH_AS_0500]MDR6195742.1 pyridoxal phosphate enzyme (YggS family) [Siphonobacter sp. SORGH_AS_0500]PKK37519.1 YggS family pyridoxal phosphate enzyme [Siphonobacter sp. SORGH_AS_0500]